MVCILLYLVHLDLLALQCCSLLWRPAAFHCICEWKLVCECEKVFGCLGETKAVKYGQNLISWYRSFHIQITIHITIQHIFQIVCHMVCCGQKPLATSESGVCFEHLTVLLWLSSVDSLRTVWHDSCVGGERLVAFESVVGTGLRQNLRTTFFWSVSDPNHVHATEVAPLLGRSFSCRLGWSQSFSCLEWPRSVSRLLSSMFVCVAFMQIFCLHPWRVDERKVTWIDGKYCCKACDER